MPAFSLSDGCDVGDFVVIVLDSGAPFASFVVAGFDAPILAFPVEVDLPPLLTLPPVGFFPPPLGFLNAAGAGLGVVVSGSASSAGLPPSIDKDEPNTSPISAVDGTGLGDGAEDGSGIGSSVG